MTAADRIASLRQRLNDAQLEAEGLAAQASGAARRLLCAVTVSVSAARHIAELAANEEQRQRLEAAP